MVPLPTRSNSKGDRTFSSRFSKKKRNQLRKDAKTEIVVAKDKLKKNVKSASWWSSFLKLLKIHERYVLLLLAVVKIL